MPTYHAAPARAKSPAYVKPSTPDVRDDWRRQIARDRTLGARALRVALTLLNFANRDGLATVGVDRLALELEADRRQVLRGLASLRAAGHLERHERCGVRGRGGITAATVLKLAGAAGSSRAQVVATAARSSGHGGREVVATATTQTLVTLTTPAAGARALQRADAAATSPGSGTGGGGGELLQRELPGMLGSVERARPETVGFYLERIRKTLRVRKPALQDDTNGPTAELWSPEELRASQAK